MCLKTITSVGELLHYNYYPVCGSPTQWILDLIISQMHPSYHLNVASCLSLDVEYHFLLVPVFLADVWSTFSFDFGGVFFFFPPFVFREGEFKSFYSNILSPIQVVVYFL